MRCSSSSPLARPSVLLFILSVIFTAAYNGPRVNFIAALVNVQEDDACEEAFEEASVVLYKLGPEHYADPAIADKLAAYIKAAYEFIQAVAADYPDVVKALMDLAACLAPATAYLRGSI